MYKHDIALSIALSQPDLISHLISLYGTAENIFSQPKHALISEAGVKEKVVLKLCDHTLFERAEKEIEFCAQFSIKILRKGDDNYPLNLENCYDSPHIIYSKGDIDFNLNSDKWIAVVGTRKNSSTGFCYTDNLIEQIACKYPDAVIISGLAFGIDAIAHRAAIKCGLKTVAFMAHGLDMIYPSMHRNLAKEIINSGGAIATEYQQGTIPHRNFFLQRNRLVAGVSMATIVVESPIIGGAIATANIADSYSRELFAMPGRATDNSFKGCNKLIKTNKAYMLESVEDLEYIMGWQSDKSLHTTQTHKYSLSDSEKIVFDCFTKGEEITKDEIIEKTGMPASEVMALLTTLEINDVIKQVKGMLYIRIK